MSPKSARRESKALKASDAVRSVTAPAGKDSVDDWMQKNPDKSAELELYLMSGGLNTKAASKSPGEMSRGTGFERPPEELFVRLPHEIGAELAEGVHAALV